MTAAFLRRHGSLVATALVCAALYVTAGLLYEGFFSWRVFVNFFSENAVLGVVAVGMTFVILSGGIDLSVGAVVACASIVIATLIEHAGCHPVPAIAVALLGGTALGGAMGAIIHRFDLPPFIVTLAGMFFARGLGLIISDESIGLTHPFLFSLVDLPYSAALKLGAPEDAARTISIYLPVLGVLFLAVFAAGTFIARWRPFGRNTRAVGGDEHAALLMGLPVGGTKVGVYALSGFCAALGGAAHTVYTFSGDPAAGVMLELDAIAAVVIGGTLLTGGVGSVAGTLLGVLIFGIVQTAIVFDGSLSSWWTRIAIGAILLAFVALQRLMHDRT